MSRIYSGKRGKSGSKKPAVRSVPSWVDYKPEEVEALITKLRKQGHSMAATGLILRDQYGIPSVQAITGKPLLQIAKEKGIEPKLPEDLFNLLKRAVTIREHIQKNSKDQHAKHKLMLTESKVRRLAKYYISRNVLPSDWKYDASKAKLLVQ
jgi:small subunit ribosomal protein S15